MTVSDLIAALALPLSCRVDQRIPKKMLIENGAPTTADKRLLNDAIEEIQWVAALKPNTVGVPEYRDEQREYLEVAVLSIATRGVNAADCAEQPALAAKPFNTARLAELVHRAVPYPVLLLLATADRLFLSMAHKRWAQNEAEKVVLDGDVTTIEATSDPLLMQPFLQSLAVARQPNATLMTMYQGWLDCLTALQVASYTGTYQSTDNPAWAAVHREALRECHRLEHECSRLRSQANKETQMAKQVDLNLALQRVQTDLATARKQLEEYP